MLKIKNTFLAFLLLGVFANNIYAQYNQNKVKNLFTLNPAILYSFKFIDIKYERVFTPIFSLTANPTFYSISKTSSDDLTLNTLNVWFQGRFYLSKKYDSPAGFFLAPEISIGFASVYGNKNTNTYDNTGTVTTTNEKIDNAAATFNTGFVFGYQWLLKEHFLIDMYFGVTKYYMSNTETVKAFQSFYGNSNELILPSWGLGIGYAF